VPEAGGLDPQVGIDCAFWKQSMVEGRRCDRGQYGAACPQGATASLYPYSAVVCHEDPFDLATRLHVHLQRSQQ
jgi:hypothetical protein